ncbi:hypothetical protein Ddc_10036 [Ditylenchus destructor]|nr:hypothetical protein Ddc_10036 [Ditylenchus destructor]
MGLKYTSPGSPPSSTPISLIFGGACVNTQLLCVQFGGHVIKVVATQEHFPPEFQRIPRHPSHLSSTESTPHLQNAVPSILFGRRRPQYATFIMLFVCN